jgi:hypothetical protein
MKYCKKCDIHKNEEEEFTKNKKMPDGFSYYCKNCYKQMGALYREKNGEKLAEIKKANYKDPAFKTKAAKTAKNWKAKNPNYYKEYYQRKKIKVIRFESKYMMPNTSFKDRFIQDLHDTQFLNADYFVDGHNTTTIKDYVKSCSKESRYYLEALANECKRLDIKIDYSNQQMMFNAVFSDRKYILFNRNEWACFMSAVWSTPSNPIPFQEFLT